MCRKRRGIISSNNRLRWVKQAKIRRKNCSERDEFINTAGEFLPLFATKKNSHARANSALEVWQHLHLRVRAVLLVHEDAVEGLQGLQ